MRSLEMPTIPRFYPGLICLSLLIVKVYCKVGQKCNSSSLAIDAACPSQEVCSEDVCQCLPDYRDVNGDCVVKELPNPDYPNLVDNQGSGSLIAGILIPLTLVAVVICTIYVSKRFQLFAWVRGKFHQRSRNYDEFMIGQDDDDDPPLV